VLERPPTQAAPWRVVSLVREPIAQSVSAFFQPAERRGYLNETTQVPDLLERFGDRLDHLPLNWFESHLEPTLGIDVYASEFDTDLGYSIVETPSVRLLLMRCEGLQVAPRALARLLDVDQPVEVHRKNQASEKGYGRVYEEFVRALRPSAEQLDAAYESRLVKHFYSAEEIERFRELWSVTRSSVEKG
jgi:hypothetical protein